MAEQAKKKIAILGGGVGAMTAAFEITESPRWEEKYDITVYQLGWRLGGKGASGRNAEYGNRIQEHGLHIWFGFYAYAFKTIQKAYELWDRPSGSPLATWPTWCRGNRETAIGRHRRPLTKHADPSVHLRARHVRPL